MKNPLHRTTSGRLLLGIVIGCLFAAIQQQYLLRSLEYRLQDLRVRWAAGREEPSKDIVVVSLDNKSLEALEPAVGRWPWPRAVFAGVIDYCSEAKVIALDILFPEADWQYARSDDVFVQEVKKHSRVVLGSYFNEPKLRTAAHAELKDFSVRIDDAAREAMSDHGDALLPYDDLLRSTARIGHVNAIADEDGVLRRYLAVLRAGDRAVPSLALAAVMQDAEIAKKNFDFDQDGMLRFGDRRMRIQKDGRLYVCPSRKPYETVSLVDVLRSWKSEQGGTLPLLSRELFKDRIVLIGSLATGLRADRQITALSANMPGVLITASAIDNLKTGISYSLPSGLVSIALILLMTIIPGLLKVDRPVAMLFSGLSAIGLYAAASLGALVLWRSLIPVAAPVVASGATFTAIGLLNWYEERRRRQELESIEQAKQQFTDMLVHDLRAPAANIAMSVSFMRDGMSGAQSNISPMIDTVDATAKRLLTDINSLLDIRKMEEGRLSLQEERVSLQAVVSALPKEYGAAARALDARIRCKEATDDELAVRADPNLLQRVFANLVWNAVNHATADTDIEIGYERTPDGGVEVSICNRGRIVPAEEKEAVFRPFVSLIENREALQKSGTGLGLTFCKLAIEAHGGDIRIESPWPGHDDGVAVVFSFPASRVLQD